MSNDERTVALQGVPEDKVVGMLGSESRLMEGTEADVVRAVPRFVRTELPHFIAEFTVIDGDLVIHFFLPKAAGDLRKADANQQKRWEAYWLEHFPQVLSPVAMEFFQADKRRLVAKYTPDLVSWYFRARGFGNVVDPATLAGQFYAALNGRLSLGDT
jgi:hypothetical protein